MRFDPDFLSGTTALYKDLSTTNEMGSWGFDLSRSASTAMEENVLAAFPYLVMIGLVLVTGLYQQKQIQRRNTGSGGNPVVNSTQQTVIEDHALHASHFLLWISRGRSRLFHHLFVVSYRPTALYW